jgi:hypothetical protein
MFGIYLFALGVTLLILCRQQVYVLLSVFILLFFELTYVTRKVVTYGVALSNWSITCPVGSRDKLCENTVEILVIASLISAIAATFLTIYTMSTIKQACAPQSYVVQRMPMPVSYVNSGVILTNP